LCCHIEISGWSHERRIFLFSRLGFCLLKLPVSEVMLHLIVVFARAVNYEVLLGLCRLVGRLHLVSDKFSDVKVVGMVDRHVGHSGALHVRFDVNVGRRIVRVLRPLLRGSRVVYIDSAQFRVHVVHGLRSVHISVQ
jgi:hypothetical protein